MSSASSGLRARCGSESRLAIRQDPGACVRTRPKLIFGQILRRAPAQIILRSEVPVRHRYVKIGATSAILVLALAGLLWSTLREGTEYYKHVDEVMTQPAAWEGKPLQLHGFVVPNSILRRRDSLDYRFKVQNKGSVVDATYTGIVPDTFKDEAEVVLKGRLSRDGFHVEPNGVMAKCPSKYEPAKAASAGIAGS
jgi:cytochrome c-type biogenesis protein CcmE